LSKSVKIIFIFVFLLSNSVFAQKLQVGVMAKTGSTFLFLAKNNFDKSCFRYVPSPTVGLGLDVNYYKSRKINIYTGVNLQLKSYAARLYDFNVSNVEGFVSNRPTFASLEVPLVLNFEKKKNNKKENYIDYGCGVILSMNKAMLTTGKQHGPLFTIADESDYIKFGIFFLAGQISILFL